MPKAKNTAPVKPTDPNLVIETYDYPLSPDVGSAVADYSRDAAEWEQRRADLFAGRAGLASESKDATLGDILEDGRQLEERRRELEDERVRLAWRRMQLQADLIPDFERARDNAQADYNQVEQAEFDGYVAAGALHGMPGGDSDAGRYHLRNYAKKAINVIAAQGRLNLAEERLNCLRRESQHPPKSQQCTIQWPCCGNAVVESILDHVAPLDDADELSEEETTIRGLVGLGGAPLLPEHRATITAIVDAIGIPPGGTGRVIKFRALRFNTANAVRPLLESLPATNPRNAALLDVKNFTINDAGHIPEPQSKPRTQYVEEKSGFRKTLETIE